MSSNQQRQRQVAKRVFAKEYRDSDLEQKDGDDQYAPKFVVTPTGARVNRMYVVGVLTEAEDIGNDDTYIRARVSGPTETFLIFTGQYQPEATRFLQNTIDNDNFPCFVAITGKARTYRPENDDGEETVTTSIAPEHIAEVDREERRRWIVDTARHTLDRLEAWDDRSSDVKEYYSDASVNVQKDNVRIALRSLNEKPSAPEGSSERGAAQESTEEDSSAEEGSEEPEGEVEEEWDFS